MVELSVLTLSLLLGCLIGFAAIFSAAETGLMSVNRYRLQHLAAKKARGAVHILDLLRRPDRLLGVILISNTFATILASAVATVLAVRLMGNFGFIVSTICLTFVMLIFAEMAPKTLAAIYPQRIAFFMVRPLRIFYGFFIR